MRSLALLGLTAVLAGCTWAGPVELGGTGPTAQQDREVAIYEAVVRQLVTRDHTYGQRGPRFLKAVYILDGRVPHVANLRRFGRRPARPFSEELESAVAASLGDLPPVTFVDPIAEAFPRGTTPAGRDREALVLLGRVRRGEGSRAEVGVSLWIDGWAATWTTYVVKLRGDEWRVTGVTGPRAVA